MAELKKVLIIYHSQSGTMELMARRFANGVALVENISVHLKKAQEVGVEDVLQCDAIAIGSPEYFGTMAGMVKDFFDRTYETLKDKTIGLPYILFVCAGNDGRGAIAQIERIIAGYKWQQVQEHVRITGQPGEEELAKLEELGQTLAAGVDFGIY